MTVVDFLRLPREGKGEAQARATQTSEFIGTWTTRSRPELVDRLETFMFT